MIRPAVLLVTAASLAATACTRQPDRPRPRKEVLARLPADVLDGSIAVSDDARHVSYSVRDGDRFRMVRDGVESPAYLQVANRSFAPVSGRHFYWARDLEDRTMLVADGAPVPLGYSRHEYLVFDPQGRHWAVLAAPREGDGAVVIADGETAGPFDDAAVPSWSPDGRLAYLRTTHAGDAARRIELVVDGAVVRTHEGEDARCEPAIAESHEGPAMPRHFATRHLRDGSLLAIMPHEGGWAVMRGEEALAPYDASAPASGASVGPYAPIGPSPCTSGRLVAADSLETARDAPVAAWWARGDAGRWQVVVDGHPADPDLHCLRPWPRQTQLAADGTSVVYPCVTGFDDRGEHVLVVHGAHRFGPYPEVYGLAISDDGRHVAYAATSGDGDRVWAVFADGRQVSSRYYAVWRPRFGPRARHLGWEAMVSQQGPNLLVLDGHPRAAFDEILDGPFFDAPGQASWLVRRKRRVARLNFPIR